jgi:phage I-like protein
MNKLSTPLIVDGDTLPTEFRLFTFGVNKTEKGDFLFDRAAAVEVLRARKAWGVDVMLDLEHQSLDVEPGAADPTARDARGWAKLELRPDGLYCVDVTWTPDGARRLREKTQRYVSPAFETEQKTGRIVRLMNVAITSLPATHNTPALVAATARTKTRRAATRPTTSGLEEFMTATITKRTKHGS